tara:strand:- start:31 stop:216 length:186 start_codon:yes stop_codon:yes gene_type:complete
MKNVTPKEKEEETAIQDIFAHQDNRIASLESQIKGLYEQHKNILENFREMIEAVAVLSEEE